MFKDVGRDDHVERGIGEQIRKTTRKIGPMGNQADLGSLLQRGPRHINTMHFVALRYEKTQIHAGPAPQAYHFFVSWEVA